MVLTKGYVESGQFKLGYQIEGTGPTALVIGSSVYYPRIFSRNLASHMQLVYVDHKGFAPSPGAVDLSLFSLDKLIDDIELVRNHLGLERIMIIGHSGHAFLALEYAKKYPEYVSHVVMIGSSPHFGPETVRAIDLYWQDSLWPERKEAFEINKKRMEDEERIEASSPEQRWIKNYVSCGPKLWYDFTFDASSLWKDVVLNLQMFDYVWGTLFAHIDITQGLEQFNKPVFLALGRYDFDAPPYLWNDTRNSFNHLTLKVFEHSGHTPPYEEPELFDTTLLAWFNETNKE